MDRILVSKVSETIRNLRSQKRLSQEKLAQLSGLDRTYISGVERGIRNLTLESLESIIIGLSITPEEFFNALTCKLSEGTLKSGNEKKSTKITGFDCEQDLQNGSDTRSR